jgi:hypothetical protein
MKQTVTKKKPRNKFETGVLAAENLLKHGTVMAVDPSIGSQKSMPAFAFAKEGVVLNSGVIELDLKMPHHKRLHHLQTELFSIAAAVDVLIIENIPPFMDRGGGGFRNQAVVSLHWAVGAILAAYGDAELIQIAPVTWHKWTDNHCKGYVKSDEHDALAMLCTAFCAAELPLQNLDSVLEVLRQEE